MPLEQTQIYASLSDVLKHYLSNRDNSNCITVEEVRNASNNLIGPIYDLNAETAAKLNFQIFMANPTKENAKIMLSHEKLGFNIVQYTNQDIYSYPKDVIDNLLWLGYDLAEKFPNLPREKVLNDLRLELKGPVYQARLPYMVDDAIARLGKEFANVEKYELVPPTFETEIKTPEYSQILAHRDNRNCFSKEELRRLGYFGLTFANVQADDLKMFGANATNNNAYKLVNHGMYDTWLIPYFLEPARATAVGLDQATVDEAVWKAYNFEEKFPGIPREKIVADLRMMHGNVPVPQQNISVYMEHYINNLSMHYEQQGLLTENSYKYSKLNAALTELRMAREGLTKENVGAFYTKAYEEMKILEKDFINLGVASTINVREFMSIIYVQYDLDKLYPGVSMLDLLNKLAGSQLPEFGKPIDFSNKPTNEFSSISH